MELSILSYLSVSIHPNQRSIKIYFYSSIYRKRIGGVCMTTETMWSVYRRCRQCQRVQFMPESIEQFSIMKAMWVPDRRSTDAEGFSQQPKSTDAEGFSQQPKCRPRLQTVTVYQQINWLVGSVKSSERGKQECRCSRLIYIHLYSQII